MEKRKRLTSKMSSKILAAGSSGSVKVAKSGPGEDDRDLSDTGMYDKTKVKHVQSMLHNLSVSLGTLQAAQAELTSLKGHEISPDGKLGGKGYVMTLRKFKDIVAESLNNMSDLTDTLADELTNPRWGLTPEEINKILEEKDSAEEEASDEASKYFETSDVVDVEDTGSEPEAPVEEDGGGEEGEEEPVDEGEVPSPWDIEDEAPAAEKPEDTDLDEEEPEEEEKNSPISREADTRPLRLASSHMFDKTASILRRGILSNLTSR